MEENSPTVGVIGSGGGVNRGWISGGGEEFQ